MFARHALRRSGLGLLEARVAGAYAASSSSARPTDETMAQIRRLAEMKKEGILTYAEFEAQKQRLLS